MAKLICRRHSLVQHVNLWFAYCSIETKVASSWNHAWYYLLRIKFWGMKSIYKNVTWKAYICYIGAKNWNWVCCWKALNAERVPNEYQKVNWVYEEWTSTKYQSTAQALHIGNVRIIELWVTKHSIKTLFVVLLKCTFKFKMKRIKISLHSMWVVFVIPCQLCVLCYSQAQSSYCWDC